MPGRQVLCLEILTVSKLQQLQARIRLNIPHLRKASNVHTADSAPKVLRRVLGRYPSLALPTRAPSAHHPWKRRGRLRPAGVRFRSARAGQSTYNYSIVHLVVISGRKIRERGREREGRERYAIRTLSNTSRSVSSTPEVQSHCNRRQAPLQTQSRHSQSPLG